MRLPDPLRRFLLVRARAVMAARPPDFVIRPGGADYLRRWWIVPRNRWFNLYLHEIVASDDDRALHDHPWWNCSILLHGGYLEHLPGHRLYSRRAGDVLFRRARAPHRLEVAPLLTPPPVVTLFLTGPKIREWGFQCPDGWVLWRRFTSADGARIGRGCGE